MVMEIAALNKDEHATLRVKDGLSVAHLENEHIIPVAVNEFGTIAMECPIVFVKNEQTGKFLPVAMLGIKPGENLFIKDAKWTGVSRPGVVALHPFKLIPHPENKDQLFAGLDLNCDLVSEEEGHALFEDDKPTEFLDKRTKLLTQQFEFARITEGFTDKLAELGLLAARDLGLQVGEEKYSIDGIYLIDEQKMRELDDATVLDLNKRGFLQAIHILMVSVNQVRRLVEMKLGNI